MSNRDILRSKALSSKPKKKAKFTYDGVEFELVAPSVGQYMEISKKSKTSIDSSIWTLIYLTIDPTTGETVFEDTDYNTFLGQSLDGFMVAAKDALVAVLQEANEDEKKPTESSN